MTSRREFILKDEQGHCFLGNEEVEAWAEPTVRLAVVDEKMMHFING